MWCFQHHFIASGYLFDRLSANIAPSGHAVDPVPENSFNSPLLVNRFSFRPVLKFLMHWLNYALRKQNPFFLHLSAQISASPLSHIFNLSLTSGKIPSVLVFETLFNVQIRAFLDANNILKPQQSGFRPGHSTITAATLVLNNILNGLDNCHHCAAFFIDLSKAFNTVDHSILLNKLSSIGLDSLSVSWFSNYLSGRKQAVVCDGVQSSSLVLG